MKSAFSNFLKLLSKRDLAVLGIAAVLVGLIYLGACALVYKIGFPLDDSWIHLTFARNLAEHGEWSFRPGTPSAGSTSPLWSALLAIGFFIGLEPYIWPYILGLLTLWAMGVLSEATARRLLSNYAPQIPWVGLFMILEWHLVWAAMSGMETLLHALIATGVLSALKLNSRRYLPLGLLAGISVWVRPDGLTLLGPLALMVIIKEGDTPSRLRGLMRIVIGFGSIFLFYLLFNLLIGDTPMPNTFYAKQAEYAAWQERTIFERLGDLSLQLFAGPFFLVSVGAIVWVVRSFRERFWGSLLALAWSLGYMFIYILRLPVYQHGRYVMPAMPVLFLMGLFAVIEFSGSKTFGRYQWFVKTLWQSGIAAMSILFIFLGAYTYARDVALIEQEMVVTAKWAAANLPSDAVVAAHDIGALGYFDEHPLIDLAGLISPEVVPFIRDEARLTEFLNERDADYLIDFSNLYENMVQGKEAVFVAGGPMTQDEGVAPMTIYRWK